MCAQVSTLSDAPASPSPRQPAERRPNQPVEKANGSPFERALGELVAALSGRRVEPICTAYLALRRSAGGRTVKDMLERIQSAGGATAVAAIVSAFSHRKCFMCEDGTSKCQTCEGSGTVDRFPCPQCHGLGIEPCSFCQGAGWGDRRDLPEELRRAIVLRQFSHVDHDLERLDVLKADRSVAAARHMPLVKRRELIVWLLRLEARLASLAAAAELESDNGLAARLGTAAATIDAIQDAIRPRPAPSEDK